MFDLTCRLSYGQKLGDCGGFYQVKSDTFTLKYVVAYNTVQYIVSRITVIY